MPGIPEGGKDKCPEGRKAKCPEGRKAKCPEGQKAKCLEVEKDERPNVQKDKRLNAQKVQSKRPDYRTAVVFLALPVKQWPFSCDIKLCRQWLLRAFLLQMPEDRQRYFLAERSLCMIFTILLTHLVSQVFAYS